MSELSYQTKIATVFKKIEHAVIGTIENAPGYISARPHDGLVTLSLNTAMLPHGAAAGAALTALTETLAKHFGEKAVKLEQPNPDNADMDLGIPPAYRLTLTIPDSYESLEKLSLAHRDVVIHYCKTALNGQIDEQLDYLNSQLGEKQAAAAFAKVTGMELRHYQNDTKEELVGTGR